MSTATHTLKCSDCNEELVLNHSGPCQKCGGIKKTHSVLVHENMKIHISVGWRQISEYYEKHRVILPLVFLVTISAPFLGLFLAGWIGVVAGLLIGLFTFFLGFQAVTKVREIKEGYEP